MTKSGVFARASAIFQIQKAVFPNLIEQNAPEDYRLTSVRVPASRRKSH